MKVPQQIVSEVVRQQKLMGWPDIVPAYAECPDANGEMRWYAHNELDVGMCEQLVEFYSRKAQKAMATWGRTGSVRSLRSTGKNILYARLYRCRYIQLTGQTDTTEADMPLPLD